MCYPFPNPFHQNKDLSGFREFKMDSGKQVNREGRIEGNCDFHPGAVLESEEK